MFPPTASAAAPGGGIKSASRAVLAFTLLWPYTCMPHTPFTPHTHDLTPVVFRSSDPSKLGAVKPKRVVQNRSPHEVKNGVSKGTGQKLVKLDNVTSSKKARVVSKSFRAALVKARLAKRWKQTDLARQANLKPQDVNDLEQGKRVPDAQQLSRLRKALGGELPAVYD